MTEIEIRQMQVDLVNLMKQNGSIQTPAVEQAFLTVPRHLFLPNQPLEKVYSDIAIPVKQEEEGRWTSSSSQPTMMAIMLEQLDLRPGMRVLEIGAGSGFNAALMAYIVGPQGQVTTIDIQPDLIEAARANLQAAGFPQVRAIAADGGYGFPEGAPYDRIILTVASHVITPAWRDQLAEGGRLVLPLELGMQKSIAFQKHAEALHSLSITDCRFMSLQGAFAQPEILYTEIGPQLTLQTQQHPPIASAALASLLDQPIQHCSTGVDATPDEMWFSFATWMLQYSGPDWLWGILQAEGETARREKIPRVFGVQQGELTMSFTFLLLDDQGAAALSRPTDRPFQFVNVNRLPGEEQPSNQPFPVQVRQLGASTSAVQRLQHAVQEWSQAGKPGSRHMRIRALPTGSSTGPASGELLVDRPWTKFYVKFDKDR